MRGWHEPTVEELEAADEIERLRNELMEALGIIRVGPKNLAAIRKAIKSSQARFDESNHPTTLMSAAAPLYFPNAPSYIWHWAFWLGLTVMALTALDAALLWLWSDGPRPFPAILINVGAILIAAGFIWHSQPRPRATAHIPNTKDHGCNQR